MRHLLFAAALLAGSAAIAAPAEATVTWQGTSQIVYNDDENSEHLGEAEQYVVSFTLNDAAPFVFNNYPTVPQPGYDIEYYDWAFYANIDSLTITGPRFNLSIAGDNDFSRVSTLRYERIQGGNTGFTVHGGSEGFSAGYTFDFNYWLQNGFASTAIPGSLNIADAFEQGFVLTEYTPIEDTEDFDSHEVLNFRFVSGGFLPAETAPVPEPATWAMMIAGFGLVGGAMRSRRRTAAIA